MSDEYRTLDEQPVAWVLWKIARGDTIFLFQPVGDRDRSRAIIIYDCDNGDDCCYDRVDAVTRKCV